LPNLKSYGKSIRSRYTKERKRYYISPKEKLQISENVPDEFKEILIGVLLGDGTLRMNGRDAMLAIQQTDEGLVNELWLICNKYNLVNKEVQCLHRINSLTGSYKKIVYYFNTLTFPLFTSFFNDWYVLDKEKNKKKKIIPNNIEKYLTPLAIAHWIMGDATFDKGRAQRIIICTDSFSLTEVNYLRSILLKKYNINSYVKSVKSNITLKIYYRIVISGNNRRMFQELVSNYIVPSLLYRIGL
jgi:LAGLIDADG DNA endonuclease family